MSLRMSFMQKNVSKRSKSDKGVLGGVDNEVSRAIKVTRKEKHKGEVYEGMKGDNEDVKDENDPGREVNIQVE